MKRLILIVAAAATLCSTGCLRRQCHCGDRHGPGQLRPYGYAMHRDDGGLLARHRGRHGGADDEGMAGPQSAAVGYPYYTLRGPRDFLVDNPPSIGR